MGRFGVHSLIALAAVAVTSVLFIDYCNAVYACGCESLWRAKAAHCNIHAVSGKHCPVCSLSFGGQTAVWAAMVVPQIAVSYWPAAWNRAVRLLFAILAFPVAGLAPMIGLGLWKGYWNN